MAKAKLLVYKFPDEPKYYLREWLIKAAFHVPQDDEWLPDELYNILHTFLPKNVGVDNDAPAWYDFAGKSDQDAWHLLLHGFDEKQKSEYNEEGLAYTSFFFSLKTGRVYKAETEGAE